MANVRKLELPFIRPYADIRHLEINKVFLSAAHFKQVLSAKDGDVDVHYGGRFLLGFRTKVLPPHVCRWAYPVLLIAAKPSQNQKGRRSGTIGFWYEQAGSGENKDRIPTVTAFTRNRPRDWALLQPLLRAMNDLFALHWPKQYAKQQHTIQGVHSAFRIPGTVFSTAQVNRTERFKAHADSGNSGWSLMTVIDCGKYRGGLLVLPTYDVAVELRCCDLLLFNGREVHGNTEFIGKEGRYERLSLVLYVPKGLQGAFPYPTGPVVMRSEKSLLGGRYIGYNN
jgi:hypothetical protein